MDPFFGAALVGAGSSFIGGLMNQDAQRSANALNRKLNNDNIQLQREFAQNGVSWKVEDAKRAGIHPLYALGANTHSFAPASIGATADTSMGDAVSNMGQDISRAMMAGKSQEERDLMNLQKLSLQADVEGKHLDNLLRLQNLDRSNNQIGPPLPSAAGGGMSGVGSVKVKPSEVFASQAAGSGVQSGMINTLQYTRETNGNIGITNSADAKERNEDDFIAETLWHLKNRISPPAPSTSDYPLPDWAVRKGYDRWEWSKLRQEFVPWKSDGRLRQPQEPTSHRRFNY